MLIWYNEYLLKVSKKQVLSLLGNRQEHVTWYIFKSMRKWLAGYELGKMKKKYTVLIIFSFLW